MAGKVIRENPGSDDKCFGVLAGMDFIMILYKKR